ncbi:MAG: hypothetical protein Q8J60_05145, partial [Thiobacillus sp.]|nr:hypothetical protein [Thiobacillus sp.]
KAVLDTVCARTELAREPLVSGLRAMAGPLRDVAERGDEFGLEPEIHQYLVRGILAQAQALELLQ